MKIYDFHQIAKARIVIWKAVKMKNLLGGAVIRDTPEWRIIDVHYRLNDRAVFDRKSLPPYVHNCDTTYGYFGTRLKTRRFRNVLKISEVLFKIYTSSEKQRLVAEHQRGSYFLLNQPYRVFRNCAILRTTR